MAKYFCPELPERSNIKTLVVLNRKLDEMHLVSYPIQLELTTPELHAVMKEISIHPSDYQKWIDMLYVSGSMVYKAKKKEGEDWWHMLGDSNPNRDADSVL